MMSSLVFKNYYLNVFSAFLVGYFFRGIDVTILKKITKKIFSNDNNLKRDKLELHDEEVRMTFIVSQDFKMTQGKVASQCLHAAVSLYKNMTNPKSKFYNPTLMEKWEESGQTKIVLQIETNDELKAVFQKALSLGLNAYIVQDAGRTQVKPGSYTVLGIGPAPKTQIDRVSKHLKLY